MRRIVAAFLPLKFYPLFSLLFGYGLSLQLSRAAKSGSSLWPRYSRRMFGLAILGVGHALVFFVGDILVIPCRRQRHRLRLPTLERSGLLEAAAWVCGGFSLLWFVLAGLTLLDPSGGPGR